MGTRKRNVVAAFQMSLDGYIQGTLDEVDWVDSWDDALDLVPGADVAVIVTLLAPLSATPLVICASVCVCA